MKTLSAIALATALTFGGVSIAAAQEMDMTWATVAQVESASTAQIVEVDSATFEAPADVNISELRQAISTNTAFDTLLSNSDVDAQDIVAVSVNEDGTLTFHVNPMEGGIDDVDDSDDPDSTEEGDN